MPNNIDQYLNTIKTAESGESVRDAVINALKNIHNDTPITNIAHGHGIMPERGSRTFEPPAGTVWDSFTADPASGSTQAQTIKELEVNQNDTYEEDNVFYSKVVVNVPQTDKDICQDVFEITENNREYDPMLEGGWDGFGKIKVNISNIPVSGEFEVKFYDKPAGDPTAQVILTKLVPAYGSAVFDITPPTSDIGVFTGWNPTPNYVTKDMECYPVFGQIIINPTDITDGWDVICSKRGVGYPLGSHAPLAYGATFTADEIKTINPSYAGGDVALNILMEMYKVGEGEGTSHSSWMSSAISINDWPIWLGEYGGGIYWANNSRIRQFLNGIFLDHMNNIFKTSIVPVTKHSLNNNGVMVPTTDSIWIPGTSEVGTDNTKAEESSTYDFQNNPDYLPNIERLDAVSTKYVRDYLNNDRTYDIWFLSNYLQESITAKIFALRDHKTNGTVHGYQRLNYDGYPIAYVSGGTPEYINIGFCM